MNVLKRPCCVCLSAVRKHSIAVPTAQQLVKYSDHSKYLSHEIKDPEFDQIGNIPWLQHVISEDSERFLSKLSSEKIKEKEEFEVLLELWRAEGQKMIPESLTANDWKILLKDKRSIDDKLFYLELVCKKVERLNAFIESENQEIKYVSQPDDDDDLNVINRVFAMRRFLNKWNGVQSLQFGPKVIIDMDYAVNEHETYTTLRQIEMMFKFNYRHVQPCHLHFTSVHKNILLKRMLDMGRIMLADFNEEHFLELYPKDRLFYLVPEGHEMDEDQLSWDKVYVIGGLGGTKERKRSIAKAVSLGIPYGSFPLYRHVSLKGRSTIDLHLPVVLRILLDRLNGNSWKKAFDENLPDRKFQKYPGMVGPLPDKRGLKSFKQFTKLYQIMKVHKK